MLSHTIFPGRVFNRKILLLGAILFPMLLFNSPVSVAGDIQQTKRNFQTHCAMCHGNEGRPDYKSAMVKSLPTAPADFSDVLFNSREPFDDFFMVVKHGGAAIGLSDTMPAFGDLLSDEEIRALVAYIKTLAGEHNFPPGELNLFLPIKTKKAFPEDEVVWKGAFTDNDNGTEEFKQTLEVEKRFGSHSQMLFELSHRFVDGDERFKSIEAGVKHVLHHDLEKQFILTVAGVAEIPLEAGKSLEFLPFVAVGKVLNDALTFQGSARFKLPTDRFKDGQAELSGIVHWVHSPWGRAVFPAMELTAEVPFERQTTVGNEDAVQLSVTPQVRIGLTKGGHVALNLGVEVPLNESDRFNYKGHIYLIWDFADGGFWQGW